MSNIRKVIVNNEINAVQITNANQFGFQFMSSGPVSISWGDSNITNYVYAYSSYNKALHNYSSTGTWNITISNPQNITALYFNYGSTWYGEKINTNVVWFKQFYNLTRLELTNATFSGEFGTIIGLYLSNLNSISLYYTSGSAYVFFTLTTKYCINFWKRCIYCNINTSTSFLNGTLSDIQFNLNITYIYLSAVSLTGSVDGILQNGYTSITYLYLYCSYASTSTLGTLINLQNFIIPNTLTTLSLNGIYSGGILDNFNFNNLTTFIITTSYFSSANLDSNTSFDNFVNKNNITLLIYGTGIGNYNFL
jgi:hypothetical protein